MKVITREQVLSKIFEMGTGTNTATYVARSASGHYVILCGEQVSQKGLTLCRANAILLRRLFVDNPTLVGNALAEIGSMSAQPPEQVVHRIVDELELKGMYTRCGEPEDEHKVDQVHEDLDQIPMLSGVVTLGDTTPELTVNLERAGDVEHIEMCGSGAAVIDALRVVFGGDEEPCECAEVQERAPTSKYNEHYTRAAKEAADKGYVESLVRL